MQHQDLTTWISERVAQYCKRSPDDIDPNGDFTDYGIDSVLALSLVGDIEDHLHVQLLATAVWDYPSVNRLVEHIQSLPRKGGLL